jgi:beta-lactamase superfamily II metal-dependent hydrolase
MEIHLLDMGATKYGDSLLILREDKRILIDGGHIGDGESITLQLGEILGVEPPFELDLLVITHCHGDHIACLPELVTNDIIRPAKALLADEKFGWGRDGNGESPVDSMQSNQRALLYALQEEDHSDLPDDELAQFIDAAGGQEKTYIEMIDRLEENGVEIIRYGRDDHQSLETAFSDLGMKILGPTLEHLLICAEFLSDPADFIAVDELEGIDNNANDMDLVDKYRQRMRKAIVASDNGEDGPGSGAAKNNQSIVIKFEADGWSALLAGDMQFAKADVPGLKPEMTKLRKTIRDNGPYDFVKLTHHTASNGFNEDVLNDYPGTAFFAHSGGRNDAGHPHATPLQVLKANNDRLKFSRTDRNGHISILKDDGELKMLISKGRLNTFTVNTVNDEEGTGINEQPATAVRQVVTQSGDVEVTTRIPAGVGKVTITIEIEPGENNSVVKKKIIDRNENDAISIGSGRSLPRLLFISSSSQLKKNIGENEAIRILDAIKKHPDVEFHDIPQGHTTARQAMEGIRPLLKDFEGVVIIGGYDVVPPQPLDVLSAELRNKLVELDLDGEDADDFIVWNDDIYGDRDGDLIPELPVSRIPDARMADVLIAGLQAKAFSATSTFGIRNIARPFADLTYAGLPGEILPIEISEAFGPGNINAQSATGAVYYMLHGSYRDGTCFWGETSDGDEYEAITLDNIPGSAAGTIVFTGCCWGALPVFQPAIKAKPGKPLVPKSPEQSIAISYILSGALAFVGCTGSHYSPLQEPYDYYGKPFHDYFWKGIAQKLRPAEALLNAKREYIKKTPHNKKDTYSQAIELKILNQFTCLGLGW